MKKIVFLLAIVFTMSSFTTEKENSTMFFQACWQDAWDHATEESVGDDYLDWLNTTDYAEEFCDDNGNYKDLLEEE